MQTSFTYFKYAFLKCNATGRANPNPHQLYFTKTSISQDLYTADNLPNDNSSTTLITSLWNERIIKFCTGDSLKKNYSYEQLNTKPVTVTKPTPTSFFRLK